MSRRVLDIKWQYEAATVIGMPTTDGRLLYCNVNGDELAALAPLNGALLWSATAGANMSLALEADASAVYFHTLDNRVCAFDLRTRTLRWKFQTRKGTTSFITAYDGAVYFATKERIFYALSAATGAELWQCKVSSKRTWARPLIVGDVVIFGSFDQRVRALNLADGSQKWVFWAEDVIAGNQAVSGDLVFCCCGAGFAYALDLETGVERWRFKAKKWLHVTPMVAKDLVVFGSYEEKIYALDQHTGALRWEYQMDSSQGEVVAILNDVVYIDAANGTLYALDLNSGVELDRRSFEGKFMRSALVGDRVYVTANERAGSDCLYALT